MLPTYSVIMVSNPPPTNPRACIYVNTSCGNLFSDLLVFQLVHIFIYACSLHPHAVTVAMETKPPCSTLFRV